MSIQCPECDQRFGTRFELIVHSSIHDDEEEEEEGLNFINCEECGATLSYADVEAHSNMHILERVDSQEEKKSNVMSCMSSEINIDTGMNSKEIQATLNNIFQGAIYQHRENVRERLTIQMMRDVQHHLTRFQLPSMTTILDFTARLWAKEDNVTLFNADDENSRANKRARRAYSKNIMMIAMYIIEKMIINRSEVIIDHAPIPTRSDFESCLRLYLHAFIRTFDGPSEDYDDDLQDCGLCGEAGGMPSCAEKHFHMCKDCTKGQVLAEREVRRTMFDLRCPMHTSGCTRELPAKLVSRVIDPFTLLERQQQSSDAFLNMNPQLNCPLCKVSISMDGVDSEYVNCPSCNVSICTSCGQLDHSVFNTPMCDKKIFLDGTLQAQIDNGHTLCPNCNVVTYKVETACIHMTCMQCRHEYCWICLNDWQMHGVGYFSNCRRQKHPTYERYNDDVRLFYSFNPLSSFSTIDLRHLPEVYSKIHNRFKFPLLPLPVKFPENGETVCPECYSTVNKNRDQGLYTRCGCGYEFCWRCIETWTDEHKNCTFPKTATYRKMYDDTERRFYPNNPLSTFSDIDLSRLPDVYAKHIDIHRLPSGGAARQRKLDLIPYEKVPMNNSR